MTKRHTWMNGTREIDESEKRVEWSDNIQDVVVVPSHLYILDDELTLTVRNIVSSRVIISRQPPVRVWYFTGKIFNKTFST